MKPVDQTTFGVNVGNCMSACVASILHLPIEEVPFFGADSSWFKRFSEWLAPLGYYPMCIHYNPDHLPAGFYILGGKSPRGDFMHAVVANGNTIVHDPHPSRDELDSRIDCTVLIPIDHGTFTRHSNGDAAVIRRAMNDVEWLARVIITESRARGALVGDQHDKAALVNVWHEYTLSPSNLPVDQVVLWWDGEADPCLLSPAQARELLAGLLALPSSALNEVIALLRGAQTTAALPT